MDLARFQALVDARGADFAAWADDNRREAIELLSRSPAARATLEESAGLEGALRRSLAGGRAGEGLRARILAIPAGHCRPVPASGWIALIGFPWRIGATAAAAALLLGAYVGASGLADIGGFGTVGPAYQVVDLAAIAFGPPIDEDILP
jgi:hypothetical protein